MRCSRTAGFHGRSTLTTVLAACRFKPVEPALVVRNSRQSGVGLKSVNQLLAAFLRHAAVEPDVVELSLAQQRLDHVEHRGPLGKDDYLAPSSSNNDSNSSSSRSNFVE